MHIIKKILIGLGGTALLVGAGVVALTWVTGGYATAPVFSTANGAIDGYDIVSYHSGEAPQVGSAAYTTEYMGTTWKFSSQANLDTFLAEPARYLPAFGGYCAYAISEGYTANSDPQAWDVVDGTLYLNYDKSVQSLWRENRTQRIEQAIKNWPQLAPAKQHGGN